jgi:hypothetical protein
MNPLAITEEELTELEQACEQFAPIAKGGGPARLEMRNSQTGEYEVYRGALRNAPECVIATVDGPDTARFLIAAGQYLYLLPVAIRMIRERRKADLE